MELEKSLPPLNVAIYDVSEMTAKESKQVWIQAAKEEMISVKGFLPHQCDLQNFDIPETMQIEEVNTDKKEIRSRIWLEVEVEGPKMDALIDKGA